MGKAGEVVEGYWSARVLRKMVGPQLFAQIRPAVHLMAVL